MLVHALAFSSLTAHAASTVSHAAWDARDGLPVNGVQDVAMGPDGYVWIATIDGAVRFDGERFTPVRPEPGTTWPSQRVVSLERTTDRIWLATEQGHLIRVDPSRGRSTVFHGTVVAEKADGTVFIAEGGTVARVEGDTTVPLVDPALQGARILDLGVDAEGGLWGLGPNELVHLPADGPGVARSAESLGLGRLEHLLPGPGGVWVAGGHGVARAAPDGSVAPLRVGGRVWDGEVVGVEQAADGTLWLATGAGLVPWRDGPGDPLDGDLGRPPIEDFRAELPGGHSWAVTRTAVLLDGEVVFRAGPGDGLVAMVADAEGAIWVASRRSGLHQLQPSRFDVVGIADGLLADNVYALVEADGALWIGGQRTWLSRWKNRQLRVLGAETGVPRDVMAVARDAAGRLWIGAHGDGLFRETTPGIERFEPVPRFSRTSVNALLAEADGTLLVGTSDGLWRGGERGWERLDETWGLPNAPVRVIARDGDRLWLGTNGGGVVRIQGATRAWWGSDSALGSDRIRAILPVPGGVWVGTEDQGMVFLGERSAATAPRLGPAEGLPDTYVHALVPDDVGALWGSTNKGLFRVEMAALASFVEGGPAPTVQRYAERDGMPDREGNGGTNHAGIRLSDGTLAFANQRGVVLVNPHDTEREGPPTPVRIEALRAGERTLPLHLADPVVLEPDERSFEIDYTALSFRAPERIRFQHRLLGLDDAWVDAGEVRRARFTAIPPGRYTFELRAFDGDGRASANTASLALTVRPHLVETTTFRLLAGVSLLGAVAGAWSLRVAALRRRERELSGLVERQTAQLQADNVALAAKQAVIAEQAARLSDIDRIKTRYFSNLSHELRTPLTLILGPLDDALADRHGPLPGEARTHLGLARRSAHRLFGLVNQLLDIVKLDAGQLRLETEPTDLGALLRAVCEELAPLAARRDQLLSIDLPAAPVPVALDRREAPKVFANLVANAIKYTPRGGAISVRLVVEEGEARAEVADTGPGIPEAAQARIFERFYMAGVGDGEVQPGTGLGLALARELTELHGGTLHVKSDPRGSHFRVVLPTCDATPTPLAAIEPAPSEGEPELPAASPSAPYDAERTTVLVVDDDPGVRGWISSHLGARYQVLQAADGADGLRVARESQPDLVITDLMMPVLDGFGLLRGLRADRDLDWLPVVLLTARGSVDVQVEGLARGADVYLTKPFSSQVLLAQVDGLLRQRERLRAHLSPAPVAPDVPELESADARWLRKVEEAVRAHLADPDFGVQELADAVAQDRSHLFRRVRELTGSSPSDLLRERRLERAAELLRARVGNVSEVGYGVGFRSVAHFSTSFRKHFGRSPTAFLDDEA